MNFVCVLKTGGIYTAAHVERLREMIPHPVVCLTDDLDVAEPKLPLKYGWPGWWSKLEIFEHDFGRVCYFDLDVTIQHLEWLDALDPNKFYGMADAYKPEGCELNSSVMVWNGRRPDLVSGITDQDFEHPGGDQQWIWRKLNGEFELLEPPLVASFKKHGKQSDFGVVVYHGRPKPWNDANAMPYVNLMPDAKEDRARQYKFAWHALLNKDTFNGHRCQAKCWLTYRVLDGEVKTSDWLRQIEPVSVMTQSVRWLSSLPVADAYIWLLLLNEPNKAMECFRVSRLAIHGALDLHPGGALNFLRISAILAYDLYLKGDDKEAKRIIKDSMHKWQMMWQNFDPISSPFRFAEMSGDCVALHVLMRLLQRIGEHGLFGKFRTSATWADSIIHGERHSFWWRCMVALGKHQRAMW